MYDADNADDVPSESEVDAIRKVGHSSAIKVRADFGVLARIFNDAGKHGSDLIQETTSRIRRLFGVPEVGLFDLGLGQRPDDEPSHSAATTLEV